MPGCRWRRGHGKPVIALAGAVLDGAESLSERGIDAALSILRTSMSLADAMDKDNASKNMRAAATQVFGLIKALDVRK